MTPQRQTIITWLQREVSGDRLKHILGVEQTAHHLAQRHGEDPEKAALAGLTHDLAKFFPPPKLLALAQTHGVTVDEICGKIPHLIHADISAVVAQTEFGITDPAILSAIANHTLGTPHMAPLDCIIFVADAIEPTRGDRKQLQKIRHISQTNLSLALLKVCDLSLKALLKSQRVIHPRTIATRNWALQRVLQDRAAKSSGVCPG